MKLKKLYKKTKAMASSAFASSSSVLGGQHVLTQKPTKASTSSGSSPDPRDPPQDSSEGTKQDSLEEWVDCGAGDDNDDEESPSTSQVKVDVRMEELLSLIGVGPLVREQFLSLSHHKTEKTQGGYTNSHGVRVWCTTYNVNGKIPTDEEGDELSDWLLSGGDVDLYALGFQEVVPLTASNVLIASDAGANLAEWEARVDMALNGTTRQEADALVQNGATYSDLNLKGKGRRYLPVCAKSLVGVYLTIWVRTELLGAVHSKEDVSVSCGVMRLLGNKGGVGVRLRVWDTYISFLCVHLSSGETEQDKLRRHWDLGHIFSKSLIAQQPDASGQMAGHLNVLDSDYCFLLGDLNYRLECEEDRIHDAIRDGSYATMLAHDQLGKGMASGEILQGWSEGEITFPPTFKYVVGTSQYVGAPQQNNNDDGDGDDGSPDAAEPQKRRLPAWCDRVLWKAKKPVKLFGYSDVAGVKLSDHKPVFAGFHVDFHEYDEKALDAAINMARRMADLREMEMRPQLDLPEQFFDFGDVEFGAKKVMRVRMANVGTSPAHWHLSVAGDKPDWLEVAPVQGKVGKGEEGEIELTVQVDGGIGGNASTLSPDGKLDTILVMSIAGSGDKFISITGQYAFSCFGLTPDQICDRRPQSQGRREALEGLYATRPAAASVEGGVGEEAALVRVELEVGGKGEGVRCVLSPRPVEETSAASSSHSAAAVAAAPDSQGLVPIVPVELQNLVTHIRRSPGGLGSPGLFISACYPDPGTITAARSAMDSDEPLPAAITAVDASLVLLMFLTSMPEPLLPKQVADVCSLCVPDSLASLDLLRNSMTKTSYATFLYLMKFFRDSLKKENRRTNGLSVEVLSATLASVFLTYEIASAGPMSKEGTLGYNDIINRRSDFVRGFLENVL